MKTLLTPFKLLGFILGFFWPRKENLWLLGSHAGKRYMGNPKYLFLYLNNSNNEDIRSVWITRNQDILEFLRDRGYEAYRPYSLKGILLSLRAGTVLYSHGPWDMNGWFTSGARRVNLWHGSPIKSIARIRKFKQQPLHRLLKNLVFERFFNSYDSMTLTSNYFRNIFENQHFSEAEYLNTGYPRNDALLKEFKHEKTTDHDFIEEKNIDTLFTYLPTHDNRSSPPIRYEKLNEWLKSKNALLVVKHHYFETQQNLEKYDNIESLPSHTDIYPLLRKTNVLITDYSSVFFDFLLLDRQIIFFPYDYEDYKNNRGFELHYDYFTPGANAHNFNQLLKEMETCIDKKERYKAERKDIRETVFDHTDFESCKRVIESLRK